MLPACLAISFGKLLPTMHLGMALEISLLRVVDTRVFSSSAADLSVDGTLKGENLFSFFLAGPDDASPSHMGRKDTSSLLHPLWTGWCWSIGPALIRRTGPCFSGCPLGRRSPPFRLPVELHSAGEAMPLGYEALEVLHPCLGGRPSGTSTMLPHRVHISPFVATMMM
jgi:hypothetical protein